MWPRDGPHEPGGDDPQGNSEMVFVFSCRIIQLIRIGHGNASVR
jgi:hypothetical protein